MRRDHLCRLSVIAIAAVGCTRPPAPPAAVPPPPPTIGVSKVEKRPVMRVVEQPGTVQAFDEVVLYPKVSGYVGALSADPDKAGRPEYDRRIDLGSRVKKGQALAELVVPELDEEFVQKEATVRQADAEVEQTKKALAASAAGVDAAKAHLAETKAGLTRAQALFDFWQSEANKFARLVKDGVVDTQGQAATDNQFKAAEAGRTEASAKVASTEVAVIKAEADREKAKADVATAEARREVAKADARRVDALRGYTHIKAPFDGIVTRRSIATGDLVAADGKRGLFAVARIDPVRVVVGVPEADAGLVEVGQEVRVTAQAVPGSPLPGKVVRSSWALEPGPRTLRTEVDLPNPDGKLRPGMFVSARLTAELPAGWAVPAAAVGKANDAPVLYLAENGKAVRVTVQLRRGDGQFTQVERYKRPGASEWTDFTGEEKVVSPAAGVTDGQALP